MKRELVERELTPEGPRRGRGIKGARPSRSVTVNLAESPLMWLHARGHISERLLDAGEKLRADYERSQLSASMTMRWHPVRVKSTGERGLSPNERQIAERQRFDGALRAAGRGWRISCGAWSARARRCRMRKRPSAGPPAAANWC